MKMRAFLGIMFAFAAAVFGNSQAWAEEPKLTQNGKSLDPDQLYYIEYTCSVNEKALKKYLTSERSWVPFNRPKSATHIFAISSKELNLSAESFNTSTSTFLIPQHVFTVVDGNVTSQEGSSCGRKFVTYGGSGPKLAYFLRYESQSVPSGVVKTLALVNDLVLPTYKLARGQELNGETVERQKAVSTIMTTYTGYLKLFEKEQNSTSRVVDLKTGTNRLTTSVSTVSIKVRPAKSLLRDAGIPFKANFDTLIPVTGKIDVNKIRQDCQQFNRDLLEKGFSSAADRAYTIYRSTDLASKDQYIECLDPEDLVPVVLETRHLYTSAVPESLLITKEDVLAYVNKAKQPKLVEARDLKIRGAVDRLVDIFSRYGALRGLPASDAEDVQSRVAPAMTIDDRTDRAWISKRTENASDIQTVTQGSFVPSFSRFVENGYTRYGCYHLTRSAPTIEGFDGASAMLLAGKEDDSEKKQTIGLRLFFEDNMLTKIVATSRMTAELRGLINGCTL
ncbi:hypothetical protein ACU5AY_05950 [Rhizobium sp. PAMB 3174]